MGFFYASTKKDAAKNSSKKKTVPIASMNQAGCSACSLNSIESELNAPKMEPRGHKQPILYFLGEFPSQGDDREEAPFSGKSGKMIQSNLPSDLYRNSRFNNITNCYNPSSKPSGTQEIECCRNYIVEDIEESKPDIVIAVGSQALTWINGLSNAMSFRGRHFPAKIGTHYCVVYCIMSPVFVMTKQGRFGKSSIELLFEHDMRNLVALADDAEELESCVSNYTESGFSDGIEVITGDNGHVDFKRLEDVLNEMATLPDVGFDIETVGLRPYAKKATILTAAIGTFEHTVAFPVLHPHGWSTHYQFRVLRLLTDFIMKSGSKICHHAQFEMEWVAEFFDPRLLRLTQWEDTYALEHTIDERPRVHNLGVCTTKYFGFNVKTKSPVDAARALEYPIKTLLLYNGMDTKWTHRLFHTLRPKLTDPKLVVEYNKKLRTASTLVLTQRKGVPVDFEHAEELQREFSSALSLVEKKIRMQPCLKLYESKFGSFNPGSPDHVTQLLRDILKRPEGAVKDDSGKIVKYSSEEDVLLSIPRDEVPIAGLVLEYRGNAKVLSTYLEPITNRVITYPDGMLHTNYNQMIAITGRLSSDEPNMQNYPKRKNVKVRGVVRAVRGYIIVSIDFGQIEARVIGMASGDKKLLDSLWTGYDIHGDWGQRFANAYEPMLEKLDMELNLNGDMKAIMKAMRQEAKNKWVFPQFFGSSPFSCARNLGIPDDIAKELAAEFWDEFKGVKKWQERLIQKYEKNLYVECLNGRRRRGDLSKNEIINTPIQGSAADIVLDKMNELSEYAMEHELDQFQPIMNIHDDLTFSIPLDSLESDIESIARIMCRPSFDWINCPLVIEVSTGPSWFEQTKLREYHSDKMGLSVR